MKLATIDQLKSWRGKKVFLRVDFNVPMDRKGQVTDDMRVKESLRTIRFLVRQGASLIIASHFGRPEGRRVKALSLAPIVQHVRKLLKREIQTSAECIGSKVDATKMALQPGQILILENLRFYKEEEENSRPFSKQLAFGIDYYVNDAFSNSHRKHASMVGITHFLPSFAGLHLADEVSALESVRDRPTSPSVAIIGGAKIESKLPMIRHLMKKYDAILLGGGVANTVLYGRGYKMGRSLVETSIINRSGNIIRNRKIVLPVDAVTSMDMKKNAKNYIMDIENICSDCYVLDIGPKTIQVYEKLLSEAKTIVWSGPLGMYEVPFFAAGTKAIAKAVGKSKAFSVVGGGDTIAAIHSLGSRNFFSYLSLGGSSMLEFLSERMLPAIKPLIISG
jgi:phosphoglycerate kinase